MKLFTTTLLLEAALVLNTPAMAQEQVAGLGWAANARAGSVGAIAPPSSLAVYSGCTTPPAAPTIKTTHDGTSAPQTWYFDVANGHPPSYYANLAVPQQQWGDSTHPFDNPSAIWGQTSIGGVQTDWTGWGNYTYPVATNNLHVLALYGIYRTAPAQLSRMDGMNATTGQPDYGNPTTYDPNHYRLWPGDTVLLRGDVAGDAFPNVFSTTTGQSTSAMYGTKNIDGTGATKWVWIKNDPNFPMPIISFPNTASAPVQIPDTIGVIFQGIGIKGAFDYTALTNTGVLQPTFPTGQGGPATANNNFVINAAVTGGTGSGATFDLTFNISGQVTGIALRNPGTGYSNGDVLSVTQNSGTPTANATSGVGTLTRDGINPFQITITAPNTTLAANALGYNTQEVSTNTSGVTTPTISGTTITVNTDTAGTQKVFTFGGGVNTIPFPATSYLIDALLSGQYTLSHDAAVSAVMTVTTGGTSYNTTWKTLTSITSPPSNGNTFTFGYDGSTWTWVTSGATGNQINIPGTNTLTNAINAAQAALAAAYPSIAFTSVTSGSTGVSWTMSGANGNVWGPAVPATAAPDLPAVNSTFTYHGVSTNDVWTFVASGATGHQINIGASVGDTILAIGTALASAYPGTTLSQPNMFAGAGNLNFKAVAPGLPGILKMTSNYSGFSGANVDGTAPVPFLYMSNGTVGLKVTGGGQGLFAIKGTGASANFIGLSLTVTPSASTQGSVDFTSGASFTFDSIVYHWGTGANPVALGGTVNASLANAATVVNATDAALNNTTVGGELLDTKDIILDSLNVGAYGVGHTFNAYVSDYPTSGSLNIDPVTGNHGGWAHTQWNILDWLTTPYFGGVQINGNRDPSNSGSQPVIGTSCVAFTNSYQHHIPTVGLSDAYNSLIQNINVNYNSDGDSLDLYTSHDYLVNNFTAWNPINPLHGIHPDGIQWGFASGFTVASTAWPEFSNVQVTNSKFLGGTDLILNDPTNFPFLITTGWDSVVYPLIDEQTCMNDTGQRVTGGSIKNNYCATDNINLYAQNFHNSVFANNTMVNHGGAPALANGGITVGTGLAGDGITNGNNVLVNNLSVGFGYGIAGTEACGDVTNTILNNYIITPYAFGSFSGATATAAGGWMCSRTSPPDRAATGNYVATNQGAAVITVSSNPLDGNTITFNSVVYTWRTTPSLSTDIQIGGTLAQSLLNAQAAVQAHDATIYANPNLTSGTAISWGVKNQTYENGGLKFFGRSTDINSMVTAFTPSSNEIADTTTLNLAPPGYPSAPTGGLVCAGTNTGGYALSTNIDGRAWAGGAGCVGIGAY